MGSERRCGSGLVVNVDDGIGFVTLSRPESLNALTFALLDSVADELGRLARDPAVRCVVLRGAGRSFCAGGDVSEIAARRKETAEAASLGALLDAQSRLMLRHEESVRLLHTMPKPTVASVQGHAFGGGLCLALACDLRVVARDAKLRAGFKQRSLSGDFGIAYFLTHTVGAGRAREILLLDPVLDGEAAFALGLATAVYDADGLEHATSELARELAAGPTIALGRMKDNIFAAQTLSMDDALRAEAMNQRISANTLDAAEAGAAFGDKRPPRFVGQ
jgi:2-(1,2-epoxy-1,2-dihydrophenyl)acetyl-CoA isomerase